MKKYISTLFFFAALLPMHLFSQSDQEDVIYTKNGSTYRGSITEQIPGVSYKIEIAGGSVIVLSATDVTKVAQLEAEIPEAGFRLVNGYKFNQFAYLGLGLGVDGVISDLHGNSDYAGAYLPIYIYYGGDILHQQITPFYTVEAGYTWRPDILVNDNYDYYSGGGSVPIGGHGGFMAGAGFGVRFYSRRRVHFDISAHVDFKMSTEHYEYDNYNSNNGYATSYFYSTNEFLIIPGFRVGIGF
jgi:hypothetical protein